MAGFRILIIDDHPIVLSGLRLLLTGDTQFAICGEALSATAACELAGALQPDLIIADLTLGGDDGLAMIEDLLVASPDARILVYSSRDELVYARHVLAVGGRGYVSKSEGLDRVADALQTLVQGDVHVSPAVQRLLVNGYGTAPDAALLSPRELQVLELIGDGHSIAQLAVTLGVSVKTIGTYRERLKTKLGLDNARMLDRYAADLGSKIGVE